MAVSDTINLFLTDLLLDVGAMLVERFRDEALRVRRKTDRSMVTDADFAADRRISAALRSRFPEDGLLSEEREEVRPGTSGWIWVVDPLDGTTNFGLGLPIWGISVARVGVDGPEQAALYFPLLDELYLAIRGDGAYLNQNPISVRPFDPAQVAAFFSCCTRAHRGYDVQVPYKTRILGSAAYSFCTVAKGSAVLAFEATPKIWDIAAGWLLVQEAGGFVTTYGVADPFPIRLAEEPALDLPTLAAASEEEIEKARRWIVPRSGRAST